LAPCSHFDSDTIQHASRDVKSSRPKWPRGRNFGLGLKDLASASASALKLWPRPQTFGLGLASILLS